MAKNHYRNLVFNDSILEIKELRAGYNKLEILRGINLEVKKGEIIILTGLNGAGKSTLLKSIFNLCEIYSGRIIFNNKDITRTPTYNLVSQGISYVLQGRQIFPELTVEENLEMGIFTIKDTRLIKDKIEYIFKIFPLLKEKRNYHASNLSGGEQQILSMARGLIQKPKLLLVDEPSLSLSPKMVKKIFKEIKESNKEGVSMIIVEHDIRWITPIANKVYSLKNGKLLPKGKT
nr:ABC transporter ATP-binding protein [Nanoarchaeum sp.]